MIEGLQDCWFVGLRRVEYVFAVNFCEWLAWRTPRLARRRALKAAEKAALSKQ